MISDNKKAHFFIIIVVVVLANLQAVYGLDILIQDDNSRYMTIVNGEYQQNFPFRSFLGLRAELKWHLITVLSHSASLARLAVLLIFMVPLSLLFYLFNRQVLALPPWVALSSAVIIQIIPSMYEIPSFVEGSYTVPGLLVFVMALLAAHHYLNAFRFQAALFFTWILAWILANDLMAEMGIFLFPALLYFLYELQGSRKKKLSLYLSAFLIVAIRLFLYIDTLGHPTNTPQELQAVEIASRISQSVGWWLPFPVELNLVHILSTLAVVAILFVLFRNAIRSRLGGAYRRALLFYGIWFFATTIPFWFLSKNFTPRYFYVAFCALTTIAMILVYSLWIEPSRKRKTLAFATMLVLFAWFGLARYWVTDTRFDQFNSEKRYIQQVLAGEEINENTQIAMIMDSYTTGGFHGWSSGYYQYAFKDPSLSGLLGPEIGFYNAFDPEACGFQSRMSCLNPDRKLIAYRADQKMSYFLQWMVAGDQDSAWTLYHSDLSNRLEPIASGKGMDSYVSFLAGSGVESKQVLWGRMDQ